MPWIIAALFAAAGIALYVVGSSLVDSDHDSESVNDAQTEVGGSTTSEGVISLSEFNRITIFNQNGKYDSLDQVEALIGGPGVLQSEYDGYDNVIGYGTVREFQWSGEGSGIALVTFFRSRFHEAGEDWESWVVSKTQSGLR